MLSTPSRLVTQRTGRHTLRLRTRPARRITYLAVTVVLILILVVGSVPERGQGPASVVTWLVCLIALVSLAVAAYEKRVLFEGTTGLVTFQDTLAFVRVRSVTRRLSDIRSVRLAYFPVGFRRAPRRGPSLGSMPPSNLLGRPHEFLKLYLDTGDERIFIEASSIRTELETMGRTIAEFLQVEFTTERI